MRVDSRQHESPHDQPPNDVLSARSPTFKSLICDMSTPSKVARAPVVAVAVLASTMSKQEFFIARISSLSRHRKRHSRSIYQSITL